MYYKLVLNAFSKRNFVSSFLVVARLLQDLIVNGNEYHKVGVA